MQQQLHSTALARPSPEIANLVEARIRTRVGGRMGDLEVSIRDNGVILRGHAPTYYVKQIAQHAAMETTGLPVLANEIEVC
jgi:hypothetical protein